MIWKIWWFYKKQQQPIEAFYYLQQSNSNWEPVVLDHGRNDAEDSVKEERRYANEEQQVV